MFSINMYWRLNNMRSSKTGRWIVSLLIKLYLYSCVCLMPVNMMIKVKHRLEQQPFLFQSQLSLSSPTDLCRSIFFYLKKWLAPTCALCLIYVCESASDYVSKDMLEPCVCTSVLGMPLRRFVHLCCNLSDTPLVTLQMPCPTNDRQTHGSVN